MDTDTDVQEVDHGQAMDAQFRRAYELNVRAYGAPEMEQARMSAEPQPMYVGLMASAPVRDLGDGYWSVTKMADVQAVTRSKAVRQVVTYLGSDRPAIPLGLDGEEHRKYRRLLDPIFTAKKVAPLADNIRKAADELIDGFVADGQVEVYRKWCEPLPSSIFLSIMGLPMDSLDDFLHFKELTLGNETATLSLEEQSVRRAEGAAWFNAYFNAALDERQGEPAPRDDMIGWLLTAEVDGHRLDRDELLGILSLLMIAGLDTVAASLACFLSYFARHPDQRARVVKDPTLWRSAVEELMRFEAPVIEGSRRTTEDLPLPSGVTIPAGSFIHTSWAAASLDPDVFDDPLTVDLERRPNPHIGFASGFHRCLGSHLARLELAVALEAWHERIPDYRIADGAELVYTGNPRAPHTLPLVWP
jgi:cytochrome P450